MKKKQHPKTKNGNIKDKILSKFTTGRTKSVNKRKKTLLLEYKLRNKGNRFVDRRIGEKNHGMTAEDRLMARFTADRVKFHNKKAMFNLGDEEEVLTHGGRSLLDLENFDDPRSDDDDVDDDGKLKSDFVDEAHFGGGLLTRASTEGDRVSAIDRLIADAKKRKAERQKAKKEISSLTDTLDDDLKILMPLVVDTARDLKPPSVLRESYDTLVRELTFEPLGKPSDKLKNEEQIRTEEIQNLRKLEEERIERMKKRPLDDDIGQDESRKKQHSSVDDLDDGFDLDIFNDESSNEDGEDDDYNSEESNNEQGEQQEGNTELNFDESIKFSNKNALVPASKDRLKMMFKSSGTEGKIDVIKSLIKNLRIHTGVSNKDNFTKLFSILMEYIDEIFHETPISEESWKFTSELSPLLYDLVQESGDTAAQVFRDTICKKRIEFMNNMDQAPSADTTIILKLVPLLFPSSDFHHSVVTPSIIFLCQMMSSNTCKSLDHISVGLFYSTLMLEYTELTHRYCPEVINFLKGVLYTTVPDTTMKISPVHATTKILNLTKKLKKSKIPKDMKLKLQDLSCEMPVNGGSKIRLIYVTIKMLQNYCKHYEQFSAAYAIWHPVLLLLKKLPTTFYPSVVSREVEELVSSITKISEKPLQLLVAERKRPKALRLYEPNIKEVIVGRSFKTVSRKKLEQEKLVHKYKQEMKGALREIRKDRNFLAHVKMSEQAKMDTERKTKVKKILNWGQSQQSEFKMMERKNKYRH